MVKYLNWGVETVWLGAVLLIPLVFLPKDYAISEAVIAFVEVPKIALLKGLAGIGASLWLLRWVLVSGDSSQKIRPSKWIVAMVGTFLGIGALSTFLSDSFSASLWGEIPGQDGYGLYIVLCYGLLFGLTAYHLRTERQVVRLLWCLMIVGSVSSVYALSQYLGWDPLGILEETGGGKTRPTSFMGNAIFFGSVLSMTIPATVLLVLRSQGKQLTIPLLALLAIQILGIVLSLSRGPWIGMGMSVIAILLLAVWVFGQGIVRDKLGFLLGGLVGILLIVGFFQAGPIFGRLTSENSLVSREVNWSDSFRLVTERPWFEFVGSKPGWLQDLLGYGPDLLRPTYLLVSRPHTEAQLPMEPDHAHNYFLHQWVEQGIFGFLASVGLFLVPISVGLYQLGKSGQTLSPVQKLVLVLGVGILFGRVFEQFVGVARVSDLTVFWVLLGMMAAFPKIVPQKKAEETQLNPSPPFLKVGVVVWLIGFLLVLTWIRGLTYPVAAVQTGQALEESRQENFTESLRLIDRSLDNAPDVPVYLNLRASLSGDSQESYDYNVRAVDYRPLYWRSRILLGNSAWRLGKREQAVRLYEQGASMVPSSYPVQNRLAQVYLEEGRVEDALDTIERSLEITGSSENSQEALGLLERAMGQVKEGGESAAGG